MTCITLIRDGVEEYQTKRRIHWAGPEATGESTCSGGASTPS